MAVLKLVILLALFAPKVHSGILIFGGIGNKNAILSSAEYYERNEPLQSKEFQMPHAIFGHVATNMRGSIVLAGGSNGSDIQFSSLIYNPEEQKFSSGPNMTSSRLAAAGALLENWFFVCGGYNKKWQWNPSCETLDLNGQWHQLGFENLHGPKGILIVLDNFLYTLGGSINGHRALKFTPSSGWVDTAPMLRDRIGASATTFGRSIIVCGGRDGDQGRSCEVFQPDEQVWYEFAPLSVGRVDFQMITIGHEIWAVGGEKPNGGWTDTVEVYDIDKDKWLLADPIKVARSKFAIVSL